MKNRGAFYRMTFYCSSISLLTAAPSINTYVYEDASIIRGASAYTNRFNTQNTLEKNTDSSVSWYFIDHLKHNSRLT